MVEVELDLLEPDARTHRVDRHPRLGAESRRERDHHRARPVVEQTLPRERLGRLYPCAKADQRPGNPFGDTEAAALVPGETRDAQPVGPLGKERSRIAAQVGIEQQERPWRGGSFPGRERLTFPTSREPQHHRARRLGPFSGCVARAVVGDDHRRIRELAPELADRRRDSLLLVAGGDEDRQRAR